MNIKKVVKKVSHEKVMGLILLIGISIPVQAGIPTIDTTAIAQMAVQLNTLKDQLENLNKQLITIDAQFESLTGDDPYFSEMLSTTISTMHSYVPNNIPSDFAEILSSGGGVSDLKNISNDLKSKYQIIKSTDIFTDSTKDIKAKEEFDNESNYIYANMAMAQNSYNVAGDRKTSLEQLRKSISSATMPKQREQLLARIMIENTLILNDIQQSVSLQLLTDMHQKSRDFNGSAELSVTGDVKQDY